MSVKEAQQLKDDYLGQGGDARAFEAFSRGGLVLGDDAEQDGSLDPGQVRHLAEKSLEPGKLVEYHCYDARQPFTWWPVIPTMSGGPSRTSRGSLGTTIFVSASEGSAQLSAVLLATSPSGAWLEPETCLGPMLVEQL